VETTRDLGRVELWQESLERSLARRGKPTRCSLELHALRPARDLACEELLSESAAYWRARRQAASRPSTLPLVGAGSFSVLALLAATALGSLGEGRGRGQETTIADYALRLSPGAEDAKARLAAGESSLPTTIAAKPEVRATGHASTAALATARPPSKPHRSPPTPAPNPRSAKPQTSETIAAAASVHNSAVEPIVNAAQPPATGAAVNATPPAAMGAAVKAAQPSAKRSAPTSTHQLAGHQGRPAIGGSPVAQDSVSTRGAAPQRSASVRGAAARSMVKATPADSTARTAASRRPSATKDDASSDTAHRTSAALSAHTPSHRDAAQPIAATTSHRALPTSSHRPPEHVAAPARPVDAAAPGGSRSGSGHSTASTKATTSSSTKTNASTNTKTSNKTKKTSTKTNTSTNTTSRDPAPGAYVNPLAHARLTPERIDQGVDYAGSGTLTAIGAGHITYVGTTGTGWPGAFIEYRLSAGADAGRYVYYAEGVAPVAGLHVGELISAGQPIATLIPGYPTGIEVGWGAGIGTETYAMATGQWSSRDDADNMPSPAGRSFSALIASLGGPPGIAY